MSPRIFVQFCTGPQCGEHLGGSALREGLLQELRASPPPREVELATHCCFGRCARGPNVLIRLQPPGEAPLRYRRAPLLAPGAVLHHLVQPGELTVLIRWHSDPSASLHSHAPRCSRALGRGGPLRTIHAREPGDGPPPLFSRPPRPVVSRLPRTLVAAALDLKPDRRQADKP